MESFPGNCLSRIREDGAGVLRNTRSLHCTPRGSAYKAGDITGSSLALEYWISSAANPRDYALLSPISPHLLSLLYPSFDSDYMRDLTKLLCFSSAQRKARYRVGTQSLRRGRHTEGKLQPAVVEAAGSSLIHVKQHAGKWCPSTRLSYYRNHEERTPREWVRVDQIESRRCSRSHAHSASIFAVAIEITTRINSQKRDWFDMFYNKWQ